MISTVKSSLLDGLKGACGGVVRALLVVVGLAVSQPVMAEEVVIKPGGDQNKSNFEYAPDKQPSDNYRKPLSGELDFVEMQGLKARILKLEEQVEQKDARITFLEKQMKQVIEIIQILTDKK